MNLRANPRTTPAPAASALGAALTCVALVLVAAAPSSAAALEIVVGKPYGSHRIGHTAVVVQTFDADKVAVYDFGRYGRTWGHLRLHGEGVMRVWRGRRAVNRYFEKQTSYRDSVGYVIDVPAAIEKRIFNYDEAMLPTARWKKDYPMHTRYRLAKDYHGVTNQCTSMALEGLKTQAPSSLWEPLLDTRFNKGQGFDEPTRAYFFKVQRERGVAETVVPLDVIDAFEHAHKRKIMTIKRVKQYRCRLCR